MVADVESGIYECEACKYVFRNSSFPSECPRCQSSEISNISLEQLTLCHLRKTSSIDNLRYLFPRQRKRQLLQELRNRLETMKIPTEEETKLESTKHQELLKQGFCPHCKASIVLFMLDCPKCKRPYEAETST